MIENSHPPMQYDASIIIVGEDWTTAFSFFLCCDFCLRSSLSSRSSRWLFWCYLALFSNECLVVVFCRGSCTSTRMPSVPISSHSSRNFVYTSTSNNDDWSAINVTIKIIDFKHWNTHRELPNLLNIRQPYWILAVILRFQLIIIWKINKILDPEKLLLHLVYYFICQLQTQSPR